mgnify:FL=1
MNNFYILFYLTKSCSMKKNNYLKYLVNHRNLILFLIHDYRDFQLNYRMMLISDHFNNLFIFINVQKNY